MQQSAEFRVLTAAAVAHVVVAQAATKQNAADGVAACVGLSGLVHVGFGDDTSY